MLDNFPLTLASSTNITKRELSYSDVSHSPPGAKGDFRLGFLPLKMTGIPRTANLISKSTTIFSLLTGLEVLDYLREEFPQCDIDRMILAEEAEQFAHSRGGGHSLNLRIVWRRKARSEPLIAKRVPVLFQR